MPDLFPVCHSILSASALMTEILSSYDVGTPTACKLLNRGLNDTYLVATEGGKFALRIYRQGWRSDSDILFELEVLLHLARAGVPVSTPIPRKDGQNVGRVLAPEGLRSVVLFTYAPGKEPNYEEEVAAESYLYGKVAAQIHGATDSFRSPHRRFPLNLEHLVDVPLRACEPFLTHRPEDWKYVVALAEKLRTRLQDLPSDGLEVGFCHGDLHGGNVHVDPNKALTVYDFDCCGIGWRAYDVAVFRWGARLRGKEKERWPAFVRGYTEHRPLSDMDMQSTACFVAIRHLWLLGLHTGNSRDWGMGWINDAYFDRALKFFHEWEEEFTTNTH